MKKENINIEIDTEVLGLLIYCVGKALSDLKVSHDNKSSLLATNLVTLHQKLTRISCTNEDFRKILGEESCEHESTPAQQILTDDDKERKHNCTKENNVRFDAPTLGLVQDLIEAHIFRVSSGSFSEHKRTNENMVKLQKFLNSLSKINWLAVTNQTQFVLKQYSSEDCSCSNPGFTEDELVTCLFSNLDKIDKLQDQLLQAHGLSELYRDLKNQMLAIIKLNKKIKSLLRD